MMQNRMQRWMGESALPPVRLRVLFPAPMISPADASSRGHVSRGHRR
jgi:hypothetical protein